MTDNDLREFVEGLSDDVFDHLVQLVKNDKSRRENAEADKRWADIVKAIDRYLEVDDLQVTWDDDFVNIFNPQELDFSNRGIIALPHAE